MIDGLQGRSYLENLGCLGTTLLAVLGGLGGLDMVGGLMSLVDAVNLNEDSPLLMEVLGLEVGGADGRSCPMASNRLIPVTLTPKWFLAASETLWHKLDFLSIASWVGLA